MGCLERNNDLLQAWENPVFVTVNIKEDLMCGAAGIVVFEDEHCWSTNQHTEEKVLMPSQNVFYCFLYWNSVNVVK